MVSAMSRPVTLSMLADTIGSSSDMFRVSCELREISERLSIRPLQGRNRKSSKVFPIHPGSRLFWFMGQEQAWLGDADRCFAESRRIIRCRAQRLNPRLRRFQGRSLFQNSTFSSAA